MLFYTILFVLVCIYFTVKQFRGRLKIQDFRDKYVMITGCDTGFGNLLARTLDGLGMRVFAGCLTEVGVKELECCCSERLLAIQLDITDPDSVRNAIKVVESVLPTNTGLWGLVNNAGLLGPIGVVDFMTKDDYRRVMEVNLYGHVDMVNNFLRLLRKSQGRIVITTSIVGRLGGTLAPPYVASKFALEGYCDTLRVQLHSSKVSVHIVEPGSNRTPMTEDDVVTSNFRSVFARVKDDVKTFYGHDYAERVIRDMKKARIEAIIEGPETVVSAYVHALTSRYPRYRYVVGIFTNVLLWPLTHLPECIGDAFFRSAYPLPAAILAQTEDGI